MLKYRDIGPLNAQAAPDVQIGGGQWWQAPKVRSKFVNYGGLGHAPKEVFFYFAKCCNLGHSLIFSGLWGGAMTPLAPHFEPPMVKWFCAHKCTSPQYYMIPVCQNCDEIV